MSQAIAEIPYGSYWSIPFFKWQGNIQNLHPLKSSAWVAKNELEKRNISPDTFDHGILGTSVPQQKSFYGLPWLASGFGAENLTGPTIAKACATGVRCKATADQEIQTGLSSSVFIVTADRTSNGPHIYYPNPSGPGGTGTHENWVVDNFNVDPLGGPPMVKTAKNVAKKHDITVEQYQQAITDNYAFQKRYMTLPFDVHHPNFKKIVTTLRSDEGVTFSTPEGLAKLKTVMPEANVPAAKAALKNARLEISQIDAFKSHNSFAVNDLVFAKEMGVDLSLMNNYGCSLIWGHPQGPTGLRSVIELIEELVIKGGGTGMFFGCAAGDSAMALIIQVESR